MRSKITIYNRSKAPIDYNYQYGIASMLYFKFYTFSNLVPDSKRHCREGLDFERANFFISSPDDRFIKSFAEGLLMNPDFILKVCMEGSIS